MADETKVEDKIETAAVAVVAPVKAAAEKVETAVAPVAKAVAAPVKAVVEPAKKAVAAPVKKAKAAVRARKARKAPVKLAAAVTRINKKAVKSAKRVRKATVKVAAKPIEGTKTMTYDFNSLFTGFQLPGTDKFQDLFADAGERSQALVAKSQKAAEEMTDLTKANIEAMVEAGKIAATGAKALGQDVIASGKDGIEQASDAFKTLAEAKSPAEFFQIQSDLARASFDRFVAESSKLTERMVKLAGETVEPLQTRASLNAERVNTLVA